MVTICSRVSASFGANCVADTPATTPAWYAQMTASVYQLPPASVNGQLRPRTDGLPSSA